MFAEVFYTAATSVMKVSIGLFLQRVTNDRVHVWIIRALMAATVCVGTIFGFIALFQCHPISFFWDFSPNAKGSCISPVVMVIVSYCASGLNGLADWCFGLLPILIVRKLHMKTHVKVSVAAILGFAAV